MGWVGGPCDFSVSPSPFGLDFGTLDFGTSDLGLTIIFQIMADPEELFTTAKKSEIILQYGKMLQHPGAELHSSFLLPITEIQDIMLLVRVEL